MHWGFHNAINFLDDVHNFKIASPSKFFPSHLLISAFYGPMAEELYLSFFVRCPSRYGDIRPNLHFYFP